MAGNTVRIVATDVANIAGAESTDVSIASAWLATSPAAARSSQQRTNRLRVCRARLAPSRPAALLRIAVSALAR